MIFSYLSSSLTKDDHAFIDLDFNKDGLWEELREGRIVMDKVIGQKNIISDWSDSPVEILINDLDSLHNGGETTKVKTILVSRGNPAASIKRSLW